MEGFDNADNGGVAQVGTKLRTPSYWIVGNYAPPKTLGLNLMKTAPKKSTV